MELKFIGTPVEVAAEMGELTQAFQTEAAPTAPAKPEKASKPKAEKKKPEPKPKPEKKAEPKDDDDNDDTASGDELSIDDVRSKLEQVAEVADMETAKTILSEFEAARVSDITDDNYAAFIERCEAEIAKAALS